MELKKESLQGWEMGPEVTLTQEETLETIVPDYCPDMARIIDSSGKAFVQSRELRDGKALLTGTVKVTVLYTPEGESGIRTLEFALPFTTETEGQGEHLMARTEIESLDSRMSNPRKLFTRCTLATRLCCLQPVELGYCSGVEAEAEMGVEKRLETVRVNTVSAVTEKEFTFSDEMNISAGKSPAETILLSTVRHSVSEAKIVGSKVILRGLFAVSLLCAGEDQTYYPVSAELPFSQILELEEPMEDGRCTVTVEIGGTDLRIGEGGHTVEVTLYCHAQGLVRREKEVTLLRDLYSTAHGLEYQSAPLRLADHVDTVTRRQNVREVLETGVVARNVLAVTVSCGAVSCTREGETANLRTTVSVHALYLDEGGVPLTAQRRIEVACQAELPENCRVSAVAECPEEPMASLSAGGIEIRFPVSFTAEAVAERNWGCVTSAEIHMDEERQPGPSIVLRCMAPSETLWDLAKRYRTTCADILAANELESDSAIPCDRLLLIPKKR